MAMYTVLRPDLSLALGDGPFLRYRYIWLPESIRMDRRLTSRGQQLMDLVLICRTSSKCNYE